MKNPIPEALLEMHYFHVLRDHFAELLGTENFQIFNPSTRVENWYGFDQGYFQSENSAEEVQGSLRRYLHREYGQQSFALRAYFLQFKVVEKLTRRSGATPPGWAAPYYRSELSLEPSKETGISQHETLVRATNISGAAVSYLCPMLFSGDDVKEDARFSDLAFVDVNSAPVGWLTTEKHFICFQSPTDVPVWKSDPVEGKLLQFDELFRSAEVFDFEAFEKFLRRVRAVFQNSEQVRSESNPIPSSLMIIAVPQGD
jgi:hypothetical protein